MKILIDRFTQLSHIARSQLRIDAIKLFNDLIDHIADNYNLSFSTNYAKFCFVLNTAKFSGAHRLILHKFRYLSQQTNDSIPDELSIVACGILTKYFDPTIQIHDQHISSFIQSHTVDPRNRIYKKNLKLLIPHFNSDNTEIPCFIEQEEQAEYILDLGTLENPYVLQLQRLNRICKSSFYISVPDCFIYQNRIEVSTCILQPDLLIDVTSIAECVVSTGNEVLKYYTRLCIPNLPNKSKLIGNIINDFFDRMIIDPEVTFEKLFATVFQTNATSLSLLDNEEVKNLIHTLRIHTTHLQNYINHAFPGLNLDRANIFLESSFYSAMYGLQGRLDLLHYNPDKKVANIIELKSGKPFNTNSYGLNPNYYAQTLMYDLMIRSTFGSSLFLNSYILYSALPDHGLKIAPPIKKLQSEYVSLRNEIVVELYTLANNSNVFSALQQRLTHVISTSKESFLKRDLEYILRGITSCDALDHAYISNYIAFITREFLISKLGYLGSEQISGLASAWTLSEDEKREGFNILSWMCIENIEMPSDDLPLIELSKSSRSPELANFRVGDTIILYPSSDQKDAILHHQIFKGSIVQLKSESCTIRLRTKMLASHYLIQSTYWNIEHDQLEKSYYAQFQSLFQFSKIDQRLRKLILGIERPIVHPIIHNYLMDGTISQEIQEIINRILHAQDYFLVWGPPGTGKTNVLLKHLVNILFHQTEQHILILSFTNRAVDELCAAITEVHGIAQHLLRVGSRYSTREENQEYLLDNKIKGLKNRNGVVSALQTNRIWAGTIASLMGRPELFELKKFDLVIVDEASQLLDPNLILVLSKIGKFVLIGDHNQLPAVSAQPEAESRISDKQLKDIGFENLNISMFERLYRNAQEHKWDHAIGILTAQGRMHEDIGRVASSLFYKNQLSTIGSEKKQILSQLSSASQHPILKHRLQLIHSGPDISEYNKTHNLEAQIIVKLIILYFNLFKTIGIQWTEHSLGVIVPYRAQIANILKLLKQNSEEQIVVTIDTVERYQGGARDIILYGTCVHSKKQLSQLVSLNTLGVDRKLNVAMTRAKEQLIIIGNRHILEQDQQYKALIAHCKEIKFEE